MEITLNFEFKSEKAASFALVKMHKANPFRKTTLQT